MATVREPRVIIFTAERSRPSGVAKFVAYAKRNGNRKIESVTDAAMLTTSITLTPLDLRVDHRVKNVEARPRMIPPGEPHHNAPQKPNRIGSGRIIVEPGMLNRNLLTKAETTIAAASATKLE